MIRTVWRVILALCVVSVACTPPTDAPGSTSASPTASGTDGEADQATGTVTPTGPAPLLIGAVMADSGLARRLDRPALAAAQVQVDAINATGGIDGRPVELRAVDTQTELNATYNGALDLADDGAVALLVTCDYDFAGPALQVAADYGIPAVSPCGSDPRWETSGAWSAGISTQAEGRAIAEVVAGRGVSTVAVVVDSSAPEMVAQCEAFTARFAALGGSVGGEFAYDRELIARFEPDILGPEPDLTPVGVGEQIVLCGSLPTTGPAVLALLREREFTAPVIAGSAMDGTDWLTEDLGDVSFLSWGSTFRNDPVDAVDALVEAVRATIGGSAEGGTMVAGADVMVALLRAVERNPRDPAAEFPAMAGEDLVIATASWSTSDRMLDDRPLRVMRVDGDEAVVSEIVTAP
ncbi:MAG: ABC transporter substrate-binding protein [Acidimicrobiales bacterium]